MKRFDTLAEWLTWQETLNPAEIELGLDRIQQVMQQAGLATTFACPLIIVAGTNGKGSTVAMLEAIATQAGYKVCTYTSPHIARYNERIRIAGAEIGDRDLCEAFERIDQARGEVALTYFEFGTLAAIDLFHAAEADLIVMEIGLGGRLDAVNAMQPDVSVITSIALDHTDWLGDTRDDIAREKAGVMRAAKTTVIGDWHPPDSLYEVAAQVAARTLTFNHDFFIAAGEASWSLMVGDDTLHELPLPAIAGEHQLNNAACAITALLQLQHRLTTGRQAIAQGLQQVTLAARLQCLPATAAGRAQILLDVAHNPEAISALTAYCDKYPVAGKTLLLLAMLRDKPVAEVVALLDSIADEYYISGLDAASRGMQVSDLRDVIVKVNADVKLVACDDVEQACARALQASHGDDRIVITGSFYTVATALQYLKQTGIQDS